MDWTVEKRKYRKIGERREGKTQTKVRAGKAETKDGPYSWQQAKSLSRKNEGGSGWGAPHGGWGLGDVLLQTVLPPFSSSSLSIISPAHTPLHLESCLPMPDVEKWEQGTTGPYRPWQTHGINRPGRGHTLPSPHLHPSCLVTEEFPGVRRVPNTLTTSISTLVF